MEVKRTTRDLTGRTATAGMWVVGGKLLAKAIDLVTLMILARYLSPSQFGLIAMAMASVFVVEAVLELPLAAALIRIKEPTEAQYNTALTLGLMRGLAIAVLLAGISVPMAAFYGEPALQSLVTVLALAPALRGLLSPKMVLFSLRMDFRRDFVMDGVSKLAALLVATIVAASSGSYWAIAAATITTPTVLLLMSYWFAPMRPALTLSEWRVFADMIGWNSASQFLIAINWQLDRFLLGRFIDITSFGRYTAANDLSAIPFQAIAQPVARPLMAAFSTIGTHEGLQRPYNNASAALVMLLAPIYVFIAILAEPIVAIVLGGKWGDAAPILQMLGLIALFGLPAIPVGGLAMTLNQTRYITLRSLAEFIVKFPVMLALAVSHGINGVLLAKAIVSVTTLATSMWAVRRLIGLTFYRQIQAHLVTFLALPLPAACLFYIAEYHITAVSNWVLLFYIAGLTALFFSIYAGMVYLLWVVLGRKDTVEGSLFRKVKGIVAR